MTYRVASSRRSGHQDGRKDDIGQGAGSRAWCTASVLSAASPTGAVAGWASGTVLKVYGATLRRWRSGCGSSCGRRFAAAEEEAGMDFPAADWKWSGQQLSPVGVRALAHAGNAVA